MHSHADLKDRTLTDYSNSIEWCEKADIVKTEGHVVVIQTA